MKFLACFIIFCGIVFADNLDNDILDFETEYSKNKIADPLIGYNRAMTKFNNAFYINIFIPVLKGYQKIVPNNARTAIESFFENLMFPIRFANNLLQFKPKNAGEEIVRFIVNTTIGFGGITDVATNYGLKKHDEDFGQTLGYWGFDGGFAIVLPFFGQSNFRDLIGMSVDFYLDALTYFDYTKINNANIWQYAARLERIMNKQSMDPDLYENFTKDAIDLYTLIKSAYEQRRNSKIAE